MLALGQHYSMFIHTTSMPKSGPDEPSTPYGTYTGNDMAARTNAAAGTLTRLGCRQRGWGDAPRILTPTGAHSDHHQSPRHAVSAAAARVPSTHVPPILLSGTNVAQRRPDGWRR